jgi:uncharacterized protein
MDTKHALIIVLAAGVVLLLGGLLFSLGLNRYAPPGKGAPVARYTIGGHPVRLRVANTAFAVGEGLSGARQLRQDEGMLFLLERPVQTRFWNKDTLLDLDVLWLRNNAVIGITQLRNEPEHGRIVISSPGLVDTVIEMPLGWALRNNIAPGALLERQ